MGFREAQVRKSKAREAQKTTKSARVRKARPKNKTERKQGLEPEEISRLIVDHREQGLKVAWRLLANWRVRLAPDEVTSIVGISLCEAASRFNPKKGAAFGTFLFYHIRGALLKEIATAISERTRSLGSEYDGYHALFNTVYHASDQSPLVEHNTPEQLFQKREQLEKFRDAYQELDTLEQEVITRHFVDEESLIDISKNLKYCRCHISRVKHGALKKLAGLLLPNAAGYVARAEEAEQQEDENSRVVYFGKKKYTGGRGRRKGREVSTDETLELKQAV